MVKNVKITELNINIATALLNTQILKTLRCSKNHQQIFDEKLRELLFITYNFSNYDNSKLILLLFKGVYL